MSLIKCPECGAEVSDKADVCVKCGYPIAKNKSQLIVYGLQQTILVGGTITLLLDGKVVGEVHKGEKITLPIEKSCELTIKCGLNPSRSRRIIHAGQTTTIQVVYDRLTGSFLLNEVK